MLEENSQHFCIKVCNFFTAKHYRSRCRSRWENLDCFQYRFQLIKFLNSVVPSPSETQPYNNQWYYTHTAVPSHFMRRMCRIDCVDHCIFHCMVHKVKLKHSYAMLSRGIPWNMNSTCHLYNVFSWFTHSSEGLCVHQENTCTSDSWDILWYATQKHCIT